MDFYHIVNRGVDKRPVVLDDGDRMRFVRSLYVFNDTKPAPNAVTQKNVRQTPASPRDLLVHLHAWCLMDNHYHLLLSPIENDLTKVSAFMKKLNMGYARFFNEKYERSGYLWQGKYKKMLITNETHFLYIPYYIHLNPLDFKQKNWREGTVNNSDESFKVLKKYRWSSYLDYNDTHNFPSLITKKYLRDTLASSTNQTKEIKRIISNPDLSQNSTLIET